MILLQSIVENCDHDAISSDSLGPGTLHVHVQPLSPVLKRKIISDILLPLVTRNPRLRHKNVDSLSQSILSRSFVFILVMAYVLHISHKKRLYEIYWRQIYNYRWSKLKPLYKKSLIQNTFSRNMFDYLTLLFIKKKNLRAALIK